MLAAAIPVLLSVIDRVLPDPAQAAQAKLAAYEMAQKGELAQLDADVKLAQAQAATNTAEATTDKFRGGWRPACGWVCVAGMGYEFLLRPLLPWLVNSLGAHTAPLPAIDSESLMVLLAGMLGLGGFRTFERLKGKA